MLAVCVPTSFLVFTCCYNMVGLTLSCCVGCGACCRANATRIGNQKRECRQPTSALPAPAVGAFVLTFNFVVVCTVLLIICSDMGTFFHFFPGPYFTPSDPQKNCSSRFCSEKKKEVVAGDVIVRPYYNVSKVGLRLIFCGRRPI